MDEAHDRAELLLKSMLTPRQWESWEYTRSFECTGSLGTRYRIRGGVHYSYNVCWLNERGYPAGTLCAHPQTYDYRGRRLPDADLVLGQFLALVTDERAFLRKANGTPPPVPHGRWRHALRRWGFDNMSYPFAVTLFCTIVIAVTLWAVCIFMMVFS